MGTRTQNTQPSDGDEDEDKNEDEVEAEQACDTHRQARNKPSLGRLGGPGQDWGGLAVT